MKFLLLSIATLFLLGFVAAQIPQCDDAPVLVSNMHKKKVLTPKTQLRTNYKNDF
jgi:hypothetical protein